MPLVFRYPLNGYQQGIASSPQAYDVESKETSPFSGDIEQLARTTCPFDDCVRPLLAEYMDLYSPTPRYPEHFEDAVISPNEQWVAFTAEHVYGPEDLLVIKVK